MIRSVFLAAALCGLSMPAAAVITGVGGPNSSAGDPTAFIAAPSAVLDDVVTNTAIQGFNERIGVRLTDPLAVDGDVIAAGTVVDSHMIFLNSAGSTEISHNEATFTFDGEILGVMSDTGGTLEAASSAILGSLTTNYDTPFSGSGPAAPFAARGLESGSIDGYVFLSNELTVSMLVTEPGDWIRVVTANTIPVPAALPLLVAGALALGWVGLRRA